MASIWKLNNYDIYVDNYQENPKGEIVELNPINSVQSIYHKIFEADSEIQFAGTVVGSGYETAIKNTWGQQVVLKTDIFTSGFTIQIMNIQSVRTPSMTQLVDRLQPTTAPVYRVTVTAKVV